MLSKNLLGILTTNEQETFNFDEVFEKAKNIRVLNDEGLIS
jgi:hypothetical protein